MKKTIRLVTPSWLVKRKKEFFGGIANLEKIGFKVSNKSFLSKLPAPKAKAQELHAAFLDDKAGLILAARGGYSSMKMLPFVNFGLIKKHPKLFAGFSDVSGLLNLIFEKTGLVTLHSPMLINFTPLRKFTLESFLNALRGFPEKNLFMGTSVCVFKSGSAEGNLKGGNLITLSALIGTKWDIKTDGCVVFLEDVDEKLHEVDRYLTQWILAGKFDKVKGLVLGDFRGIKAADVFDIIASQMKINFPVVYCPNIGHVENKITLPVGARVRLDTAARSLKVI